VQTRFISTRCEQYKERRPNACLSYKLDFQSRRAAFACCGGGSAFRLKDRILTALGTCSIFEMAHDTIPEMALPLTVTRRGTTPAEPAVAADPKHTC